MKIGRFATGEEKTEKTQNDGDRDERSTKKEMLAMVNDRNNKCKTI